MQDTSTLYKQILSNPNHSKEYKLDIAGTTYTRTSIIQLNTSRSLYSSNAPGIGGCIASEIDFTLSAISGDIPRMATIKPYIRLVLNDQQSEWIQKGTFYIDTRLQDPETGAITIHGYDDMLKAEQYYLTTTNDSYSWPRTPRQVSEEIAERMGVELDERIIWVNVNMPKPESDLTMREVLGEIAVVHAGNWVMSDVGKLRLIRLTEIPEDTNYLVDDFGNALMFGEVRLIV